MSRAYNPAARAACEAAQKSDNGKAFLWVIRTGEDPYKDERSWTMRWGGTGQAPKTFRSFDDHPRLLEPGPNGPSSAAGPFQITMSTFDDIAPLIGVTSFWPNDQELVAFAICWVEGALDDIMAGRVEQAIAKLGGRWASFPSSTSGQPTAKLQRLLETWTATGGRLLDPDTQPAAPIEERDISAAPPRQEDGGMADEFDWSMAAKIGGGLLSFFNPIAGALIADFAPVLQKKIEREIGRHTDPETAKAAAATLGNAALLAAKQATGQQNDFQAVAAVKADPEKLRAVENVVAADLERLMPVMEAALRVDQARWGAEREGRDAAGARNRRERWDMTPWLVFSGCGLVVVVCVVLVVALLVQSFQGKIDNGLLGLAGPLLMAGVKAWQEMFAYRFDGSKVSEALTDAVKVNKGMQ